MLFTGKWGIIGVVSAGNKQGLNNNLEIEEENIVEEYDELEYLRGK